MIYRRITEVNEVDQPPIPGLPNYWSRKPAFGRTGFNIQPETFGPFLKRKRAMESWEELSLSEQVRNFKRVRVLSNIKKTRRAAFTSWEEKTSWATMDNRAVGAVGTGLYGPEANLLSNNGIDVCFSKFRTGSESTILSGASSPPPTELELLGEDTGIYSDIMQFTRTPTMHFEFPSFSQAGDKKNLSTERHLVTHGPIHSSDFMAATHNVTGSPRPRMLTRTRPTFIYPPHVDLRYRYGIHAREYGWFGQPCKSIKRRRVNLDGM
jgi:hypothetical protein